MFHTIRQTPHIERKFRTVESIEASRRKSGARTKRSGLWSLHSHHQLSDKLGGWLTFLKTLVLFHRVKILIAALPVPTELAFQESTLHTVRVPSE